MKAKREAAAAPDPLARYRSKRDFAITAEPRGDIDTAGEALAFVVQKHDARRLHYDFRLELDGVMLSWAVPKGPSLDPADKRMAVQVEDHPLSYNTFEGTIPRGQYGAGSVIVWDRGHWQPDGDARQGLHDGKLVFTLHGHKLLGRWELVRIAKPGERQPAWLLLKKRDAHARPRAEFDLITALPDSVIAKPLRPKAAMAGAPEPALDAAGAAATAGAVGASAAVRAPLPATLAPQLASLATALPNGGDWSFEIKFDGYRLLARIDGPRVQLFTRSGLDWSTRLPELVHALRGLGLRSAWLDGEIVVIGKHGTPDFNALQNAFDSARSEAIAYFVFDLPYLNGHDLRALPLLQRRGRLQRLLAEGPHGPGSERLRFSADFDADAAHLLESSRRMGLEGVMAKRKDARYESRRTDTWLKLKHTQRQEFVIAGYTDRSSGEAQIGSLLLGVHDDAGQLVPVGSVGTGWDAATAAMLHVVLRAIEVAASPFGAAPLPRPRGAARAATARHFVRPHRVAEVEFSGWTSDGNIRHARFRGLRDDKDARSVKREIALPAASPSPAASRRGRAAGGDASAGTVDGVRVTHPERVIDASSGITKLELVRYYASVAAWMLPHLKGRPCSLLRGPSGVGGELFFQKHLESLTATGIRQLDAALWPGHAALIEVATPQALVGAAQMNVIEFHTWNARARRIDRPDRVVFDLDPGTGVPWPHMQQAATLLRGLLQELGLQSWLKTSGGKGLHLVVPLAPRADWDSAKGFAQAVVQHAARVLPQRFVAVPGAAHRVGKIFVDYLRNGHGATTVAAYSARARPGLGVSMPLAWDALDDLQRSDQWNVRNAREHLSFQSVDPWADYARCKQTLTAAAKTLRWRPAAAPARRKGGGSSRG